MRHACALATTLLLAPLVPAQLPAQPPAQSGTSAPPHVAHEANFDAERAQANQLYLASKPLEALPLYEDLCRQDSTVAVFAERHGTGLITKAGTVSDPKEKQALTEQGIKELERAESLGDNSPLVEGMLGSLAKTPIGLTIAGPMGGLPLTVGYTYNGSPKAQQILRQAEAAFAQRDLPNALKLYLDATAADPSWYMAALYTGDAYYRMKDVTNAGVWYAKAIAIDPDRETAYRYWGDALFNAGDPAAARLKQEQAFAAEPYSKSASNGLRQWAIQTRTSLVYPQVRRPDFQMKDGKYLDASLTTDNGDGHSSWLVYRQSRLSRGKDVVFNQWIMAGSTPNTPQFNFVPTGYVHTLAEEVEALRAMLLDIRTKLASGAITQTKLEPGLKTLLQIEKDNMLEPFILLSFNDAGLRHGYPNYRAAHRDQVVAYIDRYLIGPPLPPNTPNPYVRPQP